MDKLFREKPSKIFYTIIREYIKLHLTGNLGKVVEEEDKLICYVEQEKCKGVTIACYGIDKSDKKLAETFQLNKPIHYVIDGLQFDNEQLVYIFGCDDCSVEIKNCKFNFGLTVYLNGKCTLENTFIHSFSDLSICADEMIIKNMSIKNQLAIAGKKITVFILGSKKLAISNSNIGAEKEYINVELSSANEINLVNSKIAGDEISCRAKNITSDTESTLIASEKINLTTY